MGQERVLGFRIEVKGTDQQTAQLSKLRGEIDQLKARIKLLNDIEKQGTLLTAKQRKERELLNTQLKASSSQYNALNRTILQNNNVTKKSSSFTAKLGKSIITAGVAMVGVGAAIGLVTRVLGSAIKTIIAYQQSNSKLEAILKGTFLTVKDGTDKMALLKAQSKDLGAVTAFTASQVTELQIEYAKLGFPTKDILNMTKATLDGAAALGSELGEQAALTGAVLKQYSLDSSETARVVDVMATAASSSALDFEKLSTALPIVGATAASAGVSLERTTALLGTLSDRGIDASSSGTALRNMFLELAKQGLTYDEAMAKINNSTDKNAASFELFGKRGATMGVILASSGVTLGVLEDKLNNANGAARLMAQTMLDNVAGDVTIAQSAWEGFILSLEDGDGVLSSLTRSAVQLGTTYLNMFTALNNNDIDGLSNAWAKHLGVIDDTVVEYKTATGTIVLSQEDLVKASQNSAEAVAILRTKFNEGTIDAAKFQKGIEMLASGYKRLTEAEKELQAQEAADTAGKQAIEDKLQAELAAGLELDKVNESARKKREAEQKGANEKAKQEAIKHAEELEKIRRDTEQSALDELLRINEIHFQDKRKEDINKLEIQFQDKIAKITGDSEIEKQLRLALDEQLKLAKEEKQAEYDIIDAEKAIEERALKLENDMILAEEDFEIQRGILEQQRQLELSEKNLTDEQIRAINIKYDKENIDRKKKEDDLERENKRRQIQYTANAMGDIAALSKEGSALQKALLSGQAIMNTYLSATAAYAAGVSTGGPAGLILGPVMAAIAIASGLANVAKINNVKFNDGGIVDGASHANGGVQMFHKNGQHLGEMEGEEYIFSKKRVKEIGVDKLDAMNFGGVSPSVNGFFENGGQIPSINSVSSQQNNNNSQFNIDSLGMMIAQQMQSAILETKVVNTATDTYSTAAKVINTQNELSFG